MLVDQPYEHLQKAGPDRVGIHGEYGLRVKTEAILAERVRQVGRPQDLAVTAIELTVVRLVDVNAVAAEILGRVAGDVALTEDLIHLLGIACDRHQADADGDLERAPLPGESKVANDMRKAVGDGGCRLHGAVLQKHAELVAAESGKGVAAAEVPAKPGSQLLEQSISGDVAGRIVHDLELIQVQITENVLAVLGLGVVDDTFEPSFELTSVHEAGERIVCGEVDHASRHAARVRDIAKNDDQTEDISPGQPDRGDRVFDGVLVSLSIDQCMAIGWRNQRILDRGADRGNGDRLSRMLVDELEHLVQVLSSGFGEGPPGQPLGGGIEVAEFAAAVRRDDRIGDGMQGDLSPLLFLDQRLLNLFVARDVERNPQDNACFLAEMGKRNLRRLQHARFTASVDECFL